LKVVNLLVGRAGIEPATTRLKVRCTKVHLRLLLQCQRRIASPISFSIWDVFTLSFKLSNSFMGEFFIDTNIPLKL